MVKMEVIEVLWVQLNEKFHLKKKMGIKMELIEVIRTNNSICEMVFQFKWDSMFALNRKAKQNSIILL